MAKPTNVIRVPKPAASSFNMHRPLSKNTLLLNQVKHFLELERRLSVEDRTGMDFDAIQTEAHAAEYIRRMTAKLHRPSDRKQKGR